VSKILYLCQLLPYPLDAGPKTRAYYVLRHLTERHAVTLACFTRPSDSPAALAHIRQLCPRLHTVPMHRSPAHEAIALLRSFAAAQPWIIARDQRRPMFELLQRLLAETDFEFIHADQLWMAQYALHARQVATPAPHHPRLVLDQHNAVYLIPQRMSENTANPFLRAFMRREARQLLAYETRACQVFDQVVWVTAPDYRAVFEPPQISTLPQLASPPPTSHDGVAQHEPLVIPICVDPANVRPLAAPPPEPNLLFVGGFHWPPNLQGVRWFIHEVLPLLRAQIPTLTLHAIGKQPPPDFLDLPGVVAPGYVDDLNPYWANSRAFIVPLLAGGGMRVKILDAWMNGLPVVSTAIGAEGIHYTAGAASDGADIAIADDPAAFAARLLPLLTDDAEFTRLSLAGRRTLETHYDYHKIYPAWDTIYPQTT
jgi:glycosyltransferase involved in cell wall biosynthesis